MIQRIQTIYLTLTALFSVLFLSGKMVMFRDAEKNLLYINASGLKGISETGVIEHHMTILPLLGILILIVLMSVIAIFLYKNRKNQLKLAEINIYLSVLMLCLFISYCIIETRNQKAEIQFSISLILPFLVVLFSILARRSIKKDDDLVKSYDRLR
jgi:hypothetical protein